MAKSPCPTCGKTVRTGVPTCPHCGVRITWYKTAAELRAAQATERRQEREAERTKVTAERDAKKSYLGGREGEAEKYNADLNSWVAYLETGILGAGLNRETYVDLEALKPAPPVLPFAPGQLAAEEAEPELASFMPAELSWSQKLVPGAKDKWNHQVEEAKTNHARATEEWQERERKRQESLAALQSAHQEKVEQLRQQAASQCVEVDALREALQRLEPDAVTKYFGLVLQASPYAEEFSRETRLAFSPESRQLVVEDRLPTIDIVPTTKQRRYVKTHDRFEDSSRPNTQMKTIYAAVIAQIALRTVDEVFRADPTGMLETVVYNGHVHTIDRASGQPVTPCLITLRTTKDALSAIDLRNVDPQACLKGLNASVSRDPSELAPVRPVIEFNMADSRFIDESDVLSTLDQRPNLMELSPSEFENLITNLFEKMGLETRLTQASRDGGVDCVAYDPRPVFGGKVVIQAKRYKNTVGVAAVRDLYGTMLNEGASKGILVCTSGYGKASFDFANGKPVELLDGGNLLYLLKEHADMDAKIVVPEDWTDPVPDSYVSTE